MKIVFDLTPLADNFSGIERFAMNICEEYINQFNSNDYILIFKNKVHERFIEICKQSNVKYYILKGRNKLIFNQIILTLKLYKIPADAYVFLSFPDPILFFSKNTYTAIHDLGCWDCPDSMTTLSRLYFKASYRKAMWLSKKIITVSMFSKSRIQSVGKVNADKISVIYNGVSSSFNHTINCPDNIFKKYQLPVDYILTLSTIEPRKNLTLLLDAYNQLIEEGYKMPDLVLAGRKGWKMNEMLKEYGSGTHKHIHFTGFIDDIDLPSVYAAAKCFVFPSKYEGFGIPPLEAMACGTTVISSNAASMPEVLGDAAIYFETENLHDLKCKLIETLNMASSQKKSIIASGIKRASLYQWHNEAQKLDLIIKGDR